ncbi:MAG: hypothetical protein WEB00_13320 [Dehalococcoidia bacterium]
MAASLSPLAVRAIPILVESAQRGETISYRDLAAAIGTAPYVVRRPLLRHIKHKALRGRYPLLTAIVVDQETGLSTYQAGPIGFDLLDEQARSQFVRDQQEEVFAYEGWPQFLRELGLQQSPESTPDVQGG